MISAGQTSDKATVEALVDGLKPAGALAADRGFDARAVIDMVGPRGGCAHIPTQRGPKVQRSIDPGDLPPAQRRRTSASFRRVATHFDKLARNFLAAVLLT